MIHAGDNRQIAIKANSNRPEMQTILSTISEEAAKGHFKLRVEFENQTEETTAAIRHTLEALGYNVISAGTAIVISWE